MKLHVGNLPFSVDDAELKNLFAEYNAEDVTLIMDKFSGRSKGFGFVTISDDAMAQKAIADLNDKDVQGRQIKVSEARPMEERPERPRRSFNGGGDRDRGRSFGGGNRGGGFGGGRGRY